MTSRSVAIRRLRPDDAERLSICFRRCYGTSYASDLFYDVARLQRAIEDGALRSAVAVDEAAGTLVGHTGLTVRHARSLAVEAGNTVVDPDYRGHGILGRMGKELGALCREHGYVAYLHYPTTAHDIMQRSSVTSGFETGVMLAYIAEQTTYRDIDRRPGRLAATIVYQPFRDAPERGVLIPSRYRSIAEATYASIGLRRRFADATGGRATTQNIASPSPAGSAAPVTPPGGETTRAASTWNPRRGLLRVHVERAGADFAKRLADLRAGHPLAVAHLDLAMDDPGIFHACEAARQQGFFFCGILPEFAHTDVLRLQQLAQPAPTLFRPFLVNADARRQLAFAVSDFEAQ